MQNRVLVDTAEEADKVLQVCQEKIDEWKYATMQDFKLAAGKAASRMDMEYGWLDISNATIKKTSFGYEVKMPHPVLLKGVI